MGRKPLGTGKATGWVRLTHPDANGTHLREWPLSELTQETVRERWGSGDYKVYWFANDPDNVDPGSRHRPAGNGPIVTFDEPEKQRIPAPLPVAPPPPPTGFEQALQFMALADQRAATQLQSIIATAQTLGGGGGGSADMMRLLLENQRLSMQQMLDQQRAASEASLALVRGELATLRSELEDDDGEDGAPIEGAVRAAAPLFRRGQSLSEGLKNALGNYVTEHPDEVFSLLKQVPGVIAKISEASQAQATAVQQAAPQRPRAVVTPIRVVEQAPASPASEPVSGLNAVLSSPPKDAPTTMDVALTP